MCGGVRYTIKNEPVRVYFPNPKASLPILMKDGNFLLIPWGRRKEQQGKLPMSGWARLDSINAGKWDFVQPKPVKIAVDGFMEKDHNNDSHWFNLEDGQYIQGLIARYNDEQRVYVVTIEPDPLTRQIHDRWPRIVGSHQS